MNLSNINSPVSHLVRVHLGLTICQSGRRRNSWDLSRATSLRSSLLRFVARPPPMELLKETFNCRRGKFLIDVRQTPQLRAQIIVSLARIAKTAYSLSSTMLGTCLRQVSGLRNRAGCRPLSELFGLARNRREYHCRPKRKGVRTGRSGAKRAWCLDTPGL